jgi:hypothetical protein
LNLLLTAAVEAASNILLLAVRIESIIAAAASILRLAAAGIKSTISSSSIDSTISSSRE